MAIAGALAFDGGWVDPPDVARMLAAMALERGRPQVRNSQGLSLGRCDRAQWSDPDATGSAALFDGRLDNRAEVLEALDLAGRVPQPTDGDLVLAAWRRWGPDFPDRLFGDFACAVWDASKRQLALARDGIGLVPLYWWRLDGVVAFATEPRGLHVLPQVPKEVDQAWMARWLLLMPATGMASPYREIGRVIPGETLLIDAKGMTRHRHWRPESLAPIRLKDDHAYVEATRALMLEAVRCRAGSSGPVAVHLSGGLDSSFVTAATSRVLAEQGRRVIAFTAAPDDPYEVPARFRRFGDEWSRAAKTAAFLGNVEHVRIPNNAGPVMDAVEQSSLAAGIPVLNPFNQNWINAIAKGAQARGCKRMLSGQMGNMSFSYDGMAALPVMARRGRWLQLLGHLRALNRTGHSWNFLLSMSIEPLFSERMAMAIRRALGKTVAGYDMITAVNPDFARRMGQWDEAQEIAGNMMRTAQGRDDPRLAVFGRIDPGLPTTGLERLGGVRTADPTADRRLLEFCLALPTEQFLRNGTRRFLARRVLDGWVPDEVRLEPGRGYQAADWGAEAHRSRAAISAELDRLAQSPLASECLDLPRLRRLLDTLPSSGFNDPVTQREHNLALTRAVAAGRFIRQVEGGNR